MHYSQRISLIRHLDLLHILKRLPYRTRLGQRTKVLLDWPLKGHGTSFGKNYFSSLEANFECCFSHASTRNFASGSRQNAAKLPVLCK